MSDASAKPGFFRHIMPRHSAAVADVYAQAESVLEQLASLQKSFLEKGTPESGGREQKSQRDWLALGKFEKGDALNEWVDKAAQSWAPQDWVAHFDALRALQKETDRLLLEKKARRHTKQRNCTLRKCDRRRKTSTALRRASPNPS